METTIGINQRIPIEIIELALKAVLDNRYDDIYAAELARMEFSGENRIKKTVRVINRIVKTNVLIPYIMENAGKVRLALKNVEDKGMICVALVNAAYPFCYDVTSVLGRYFHAQKEIGTPLITTKLSAKYGTNRSLPNGLYCILPMLIEAGFIKRPRPGFYQLNHLLPQSEITQVIYQKSFLLNNPTLNEDYHFSNHFYFEYIG